MAGKGDPDYIVALTTLASEGDATSLIRRLVEARVVACGTVIPAAVSVYRWEGRVTQESEALVLLKTTRDCWDALSRAVAEWHPYDVPELIAVGVEEGSHPYLQWLSAETQSREH